MTVDLGKNYIFAPSKLNNTEMANHKSSIKRIRSNDAKRITNRYQAKTTRTVLKKLRGETDKKAAEILLPKVITMLDKLAKKNVIHKNKASNLKSKLTKHVAKIGK
jgi:small subunit ribosomal protein S20